MCCDEYEDEYEDTHDHYAGEKKITCNFCGDAVREENDKLFVVGMNNAAICEDCIRLAVEGIAERRRELSDD